jgi:hypothetical protein
VLCGPLCIPCVPEFIGGSCSGGRLNIEPDCGGSNGGGGMPEIEEEPGGPLTPSGDGACGGLRDTGSGGPLAGLE